jgi:hypothetical protein
MAQQIMVQELNHNKSIGKEKAHTVCEGMRYKYRKLNSNGMRPDS